jgi:prepilin-type N-terminal cleavage/methylation domain-containing protein
MSTKRSSYGRRGFSLLEMVIAFSILAIVVTAVLQRFVVENRTYSVTDQVVEAQQNLRVVAWLLERDARMTGFMVPEAASLCAIDSTTGPDSVWFSDADAIDPNGQQRNALGAEVQTGYFSSIGTHSLIVDDVILDGVPFYDTDGDGVADADFVVNGGAILVDLNDPAQGAACGVVTDVATGRVRVEFQTDITPSPSPRLLLVPAHVYEVDLTGPDPRLLRNRRLLATDVEDLQLAFFFDRDGDGVIDGPDQATGELPGGEGGAPVYDASAWDNRDLREVRVNLVTRTRADDPTFDDGQVQTTGNRVAPALRDGFRRRVHSSTVRVRNVGFRGSAI